MELSLRARWRLAGIKAELEFLMREGFTGEAEYTVNGTGECHRRLCRVRQGKPKPTENTVASADLAADLERWVAAPEVPLRVFFSGGAIRRVET